MAPRDPARTTRRSPPQREALKNTGKASSKNKHATKHYRAAQHAIMRSAQPQETWGWCFVDEVMLEPEDLGMGAAAQGPA